MKNPELTFLKKFFMISAVVLTKDEEKKLARCLNSLSWCDEIVVIDDYSQDGTLKIAKEKKALVFQRKLADNFSAQRNFGLSKAKGEWVLFVDADEEVSENLRKEILIQLSLPSVKDVDGFYFKRKDFFLGRWLNHGETASVRLLRLGRRGKGIWKGSVDETWEIKGKTKSLSNPLLHYSHSSLVEFLNSLNRYSSLNAKQNFENNRKLSFFDWFKPLGKFVFNYFFKLGFLDGIRGLMMAALMSFHSFLVRGKQYLLEINITPKDLRKTNPKDGGKIFSFFILVWGIVIIFFYLKYLLSRKGIWLNWPF